MTELKQKKLTKIVGLKKEEFNEFVRAKEISLSKPRLIPTFKLGDEIALTSVLLSSFRLIKEFRQHILSEAKMQKGGQLYFYTEVSFKDHEGSRFDGLITIVKAGKITDAAIIEVKNGKNALDVEQLDRYQKIAKQYAIPKFLTISNQFVSVPSQSPVNMRTVKGIDMYHFSWSYLLTIAHVLLFDNETNIEDTDQVEIMKEVIEYLEHEKSGVFGINQMSPGWGKVIDRINAGESLKAIDEDVIDAVSSWQQEEQDMALILSRDLGVLVLSGIKKYKNNLQQRLDDNAKELVTKKALSSTLRIKGAISNIDVHALLDKRTIEMIVSLTPPREKTTKGQLSWLRKQLENCHKKNPNDFNEISGELYIEIQVKNGRVSERFSISAFEEMLVSMKGKEIKGFNIIRLKDFGKQFSSPKKFVEVLEMMMKNYYKVVIQHLVKWEAPAPKMVEKQDSIDEEFIDEDSSADEETQDEEKLLDEEDSLAVV